MGEKWAWYGHETFTSLPKVSWICTYVCSCVCSILNIVRNVFVQKTLQSSTLSLNSKHLSYQLLRYVHTYVYDIRTYDIVLYMCILRTWIVLYVTTTMCM